MTIGKCLPALAALCLLLPASSSWAQDEEAKAADAKDASPATEGLEAVDPALEGGRMESTPDALEGVGITENLGGQIPLELVFRDENGAEVTLGDYVTGERPTIFMLVYYTCPMLCNLVMNGFVDALGSVPFTPGDEFEVVTVSIDPTETPTLARLKKQNYIRDYGKPQAAAGWHFLTGKEDQIRKLADAIGFGYKYDESRGEYAHSAAIYVTTPQGVLSRYLYGVLYQPKDIRFALLEASEGKIGGTIDRVLLFCYHYDASSGTYAPAAFRLMQVGGTLTVIILGTMLLVFWRKERRRKREQAGLSAGGSGGPSGGEAVTVSR